MIISRYYIVFKESNSSRIGMCDHFIYHDPKHMRSHSNHRTVVGPFDSERDASEELNDRYQDLKNDFVHIIKVEFDIGEME